MASSTDINALYQSIAGRAADPTEIANWANAINSGQQSLSDLQGALTAAMGAAPTPAPAPAPAASTAQYGYDPTAAMNAYKTATDPYARFREDNPDAFKGPVGAPVDLGNGLYGSRSGDNGVTVAGLNSPVGSTVYSWTPDGSGGYTPTASTVEAPSQLGNFLAKVTPAVIAAMGAGAAGFGPFAPGAAGATGAGAAGWTSGYDLAMGSDLLGMTGLGAAGAGAGAAAGLGGAASGGAASGAGAAAGGAALGGGTAAAGAAGLGSGLGGLLNSPLAATVAGAALGGVGGSKQDSTTTTVEPWSAQQPYLRDLYANAQGIFNANKNPTAMENAALAAIQQRAMLGSPLQTAAKSNIQSLLGQDPTKAYGIGQKNEYLGKNIDVGTNPMLGMNNPYLQTAIDSAQSDVTRAMQPQFQAAQRASGSFGNSGLQETYARELPKALGTISNNMRMADYTSQQQLQENALNRSVAAQQADLTRNSGIAQQGIQNNIGQYNTMLGLQTDAAYRAPGLAAADYNDPQMAYNTSFAARQNAFMPLQQYQSAISGNPGSSTTSPYFTNPAANILGGATAGLGLWNAAQKSGVLGGGGNFNSWMNNNQAVLGANPDLSFNDILRF